MDAARARSSAERLLTSAANNADGPKAAKRRLRVAAIIVCILLVGVAWIIYGLLPYALVRPTRVLKYLSYNGFAPQRFGLRAEGIVVEAEPGLWLHGWFIHAAVASGSEALGTILLIHGHSSSKEAMLGTAKLFSDGGFNCLDFDMRAHGESGGVYCTFGYYERRDCSRLIDEAARRFGPLGPLAVFGNSMGGAIALQAMAYDPRIRCGIIESSFATLREVAHDYLRAYTGVPLAFVADLAMRRAERLAKFSVDDVRPEEAARHIERPVLVVHGTDDRNISARYGERIARNLPAPGSEWDPVEGASHDNLWKIGGAEYRRKLLSFMTKYDN